MEDGSKEFNLEAEIALLNERIESKKKELEVARGVKPETKEVLKEVITPQIYTNTGGTVKAGGKPTTSQSSYLDDIDKESVEKVNDLIDKIQEQGVEKTISEAKKSEPFILDAFHDALVDKLYDELKAHGHIK